MRNLHNRVYRMQDDNALMLQGDPMELFGRILQQQVWYQRRLDSQDIARVWLLIGHGGNSLRNLLREQDGQEPSDTLCMCFATWALLRRHPIHAATGITIQLSTGTTAIAPEAVRGYFETYSLTLDSIAGPYLFDTLQPRTQQLERTPLVRFPFVEVNGRFYCPSRAALELHCSLPWRHLLSDAAIGSAFGKAQEKYVGSVLDQTAGPDEVVREHNIPRRLGYEKSKGEKVCDFALLSGNRIVLFESKWARPNERANAVRGDKLRVEVLRKVGNAIRQCAAVASRIRELELPYDVHAVVVVHEDFHLMGSPLDEVEFGDSTTLNADKVHILTLKEFDRAAQLAAEVSGGWNAIVQSMADSASTRTGPTDASFSDLWPASGLPTMAPHHVEAWDQITASFREFADPNYER